MTTDSKKAKALDLAITQIDRQFGKGSIMRMGSEHVHISDNVISTGCLSLDVALGVGGIPRGRLIEVFGLKGEKLNEPNPKDYKKTCCPRCDSENEVPSIAIIPFRNKGKEEDAFYAYGISEDLISDVASAGLIRVASLEEIEDLGSFERILDAPEGMFKSKGKSFAQRANNSMKNMYLIFVQQKNLMEKNPENLMKAMGYFEFFYMEQLRKKQKSIKKFKETWPDIHFSTKKDIKSLYSLNQARKTMRESMGLTLRDDVQVALERYMTMYNFLKKAEKKKN